MKADYVLFLDSDMKFKKDTLMKLMKHDLPIVAANYSTKEIAPIPLAEKRCDDGKYMRVHTSNESSGLEEVAQVGMGIMLIKTKVFEIMSEPWFPMTYDGKEIVGEDIYFCRKALENGIPIFIDHDVSKGVSHVGNFEYTTQLAYESWQYRTTQASKQPSEIGLPELILPTT